MTSTTLWLILRWTVGLFLASFLVYRFRKNIRTAIAWFFPISKRMQPNFFDQMRRYTAIASVVLALLLMLAFNLTYQYFTKTASDTELLTQDLQSLSLPQIDQKPSLKKQAPPTIFDSLSTAPAAPVSTPQTTLPKAYEDAPTTFSPPYYLQVGAFQELENAQICLNNWQTHPQHSPVLATFPDHAPYKVLLGPFSHLDAARRHQRQYRIRAFPRLASYYHSIQFLKN
ncbi:MAG: SPOR domain-containing protein [Bacteroidota bacterium]